MKFCSNILRSFITVTLALFFFSGASEARPYPNNYDVQQVVPRTITVDKLGRGDFASVQQALDSIPSNNSVWTRIYIKSGTYVEQIEIPREKPYIILEGDPNDHFPVIESGLYGGDVEKSPTFTLHADNFVAKNIVFKNTYNRVPPPKNGHGRKMTQAPAVSIHGDKASFYRCSFLSLQDTLGDIEGRHYFYDCYIQGLVDFIWGFGQSIYEKCHIDSLGSGSITAQGRDGENKPDGFVFKDCYISGSGRPTKLGRAYRPYARVLFVRTYMEDIIDPLGWEAPWNNGKYDLTAFSEVDCKGPGADMSYRVPWEKKQLSAEEVSYFSNAGSFINKDGWMEKQPK